MGGMPSTSYPAPTKEEKLLQQKQLELLDKSEAREALWEPVLMRQMGYRMSQDPETGEQILEKLGEEEHLSGLSALERQAYNISKMTGERQLKALRGELEIDPGVERDLAKQKQALGEEYTRRFGSGWETSTPGIEALANWRQRAAETRNAVRRGEMTASEALAQSRADQLARSQTQFMQSSGEPTRRAFGLVGAYETPKSWLERAREQQFQGKQLKANMKAQQMQGISSGFGSAGCCFNFLEADGDIHEDVQSLRDALFTKDSPVAIGYRKMATEFVPLMRQFPDFKDLVRETMTKPITEYAKWVYGKNDYGYIYAQACMDWAKRWYKLGVQPGGKEMTWEEFWDSKDSYNPIITDTSNGGIGGER